MHLQRCNLAEPLLRPCSVPAPAAGQRCRCTTRGPLVRSGSLLQQGGGWLHHSRKQHRGKSVQRQDEGADRVTPSASSADVGAQPAGSKAAALIGASAQQLFETAVHSLEMFEPREASGNYITSLDDETGVDSVDEHIRSDVAAAAYKTNYEVLQLDEGGKVRRMNKKRRDLLREYHLQPRDLRRIDTPKSSPSISIKDNVLLLCLGGVRAIVTAHEALVFDPASSGARRILDTVVPRLAASASQRLAARQSEAFAAAAAAAAQASQADLSSHQVGGGKQGRSPSPAITASRQLPFELEVLEGVLTVATSRLDSDVVNVTNRVRNMLTKLPGEINPVNLEELRRIKQALVELENKADALRGMLEAVMDDEDELREINLSNRPRREERRKQRDVDRMKRQLERAREEMEERRSNQDEGGGGGSNGSSPGTPNAASSSAAAGPTPRRPPSSSRSGSRSSSPGPGPWEGPPPWGGGGVGASMGYVTERWGLYKAGARGWPGAAGPAPYAAANLDEKALRAMRMGQLYGRRPQGSTRQGNARQDSGRDDGSWDERDGERWGRPDRDDPEEEFQDAQDALEEMAEAEEEEAELEEVEDLLEYYLQRATAIQNEAERLLEGARDLEESIGVSLSARRYEVNRLELMLSMGSFAAALGAMIAGIFGMNMRSTLEMSVFGFWGTTLGIFTLCVLVFIFIFRYTQKRKIL